MNTPDDFLYLTDAALEALKIPSPEIADAIEAALRDKASGRLHTAPKAAVLPGGGRYMMATLAVGEDPPFTVLKAATVSPDNPERGLPAINGTIIVLDAVTGLLRAVLGANWVTATRTAALSTVAARRLADPGATSVAFVGCGVQAHSHLEAFAAEFPLREIRAFGRGKTNVERLCESARAMGLDALAPETAEDALSGADLVVTSVTLDYEIAPFLDARWLKPGAFAAITDLGIPWIETGLPAFGRIYVDDLEQEEASERKLVPEALVTGDLTGLVTGGQAAGFDPARPSAFAFRGIAIGDFAAAALAVRRAETRPRP